MYQGVFRIFSSLVRFGAFSLRVFPKLVPFPFELISDDPLRPTKNQVNSNPRQLTLLDVVRVRGSITVEELADKLGVTLQTVRRDVQRLSESGLLTRFHGGVRVPSSTVENIAYPQRESLNAAGKGAIARAVAGQVPERLLPDHQHRHDHRGHSPRTAAPHGAASAHQRPQCRRHPQQQPAMRSDRGRRRGAYARSRNHRRGGGGLHPPVQGGHRPDRHLGHRGRRLPARLRLPRGQGGADHHRAFARGLAGGRPQQIQSPGHGGTRAPVADRPPVHGRCAAGAISPVAGRRRCAVRRCDRTDAKSSEPKRTV